MLPRLILGAIGSKLFQGSKNTIANGIRHSMGTVGGFLADRIQRDETDNPSLKKSNKTETPKQQQNQTEINAKSVESIEQLGKQVKDAIGVTINTTNKGFVFVNRHVEHYGEQVSRSLESLGNLLTKLLYTKETKTKPANIFVSPAKKKDDDDGPSLLSILGALFAARKVVSFLKNGLLLSKIFGKKTAAEIIKKPGILKAIMSPVFKPFKILGRAAGRAFAPLAVGLSALDFIDAYNRDPSKETGGDVFWDYTNAGLAGAAGGALAGSLAGPIGTLVGGLIGGAAGLGFMFLNRSFRKNGSINSLEINKIIFDAGKIKFDILNTLEFKKRVPDDGYASKIDAVKPKGNVGSVNRMLDDARGGPGGPGMINSWLDSMRGGPGGAGFFNSLADRVFGTGQKNINNDSSKKFSTTSMPVSQTAAAHATSNAVDNAMKMLGANEHTNRKAIREYLANGGVNLDPATNAWCAAFVNSSLQQQGIKGSGSLAAGSFQNFGEKIGVENLSKGDVLVNNKYSPRTGMKGSHVGIATGHVKKDDLGNIIKMEMISGNDKDSVRKSWVSPGDIGNQYTIRRANRAIKQLPSQPSQQTLIPPQQTPKDLTPIDTAPAPIEDHEQIDDVSSPEPRPKEQKQSSYQGDLDHRTEKRVKPTTSFAMYFATENNFGEA